MARAAARSPPRGGPGPAGFTYVEALLAAVVVGSALTAGLLLMGTGARSDVEGLDLLQARSLAQEIEQLLEGKAFEDPVNPGFGPEPGETGPASYDDLDDFNGVSFSPPVNSRLEVQADLAAWSQVIAVEYVNPGTPSTVVPPRTSSAVRVTVRLTRAGAEVTRLVWLRVPD